MHIRRMPAWLAAGTLLAARICAAQWEVTLAGSTNLSPGAPLLTVVNSGGAGTRADPLLYRFTGGGLNCGPHRVYAFGDVDDGFGTSFTLDMGGYGIAGESGYVSFGTNRTSATLNWDGIGNIAITNVADVLIGAVETYTEYNQGHPGGLQIGTATAPAGQVRIDHVYTHSARPAMPGGNVTIYGAGDVRIETAAGSSGDITTYARRGNGGAVTVRHQGSFAARDILGCRITESAQEAYGSFSGQVPLDGGGAGGTVAIRDIDTSVSNNYVAFDSGGESHIQGLLGGTNGLPVSGLADIGTALRAPQGRRLYYRPALNPGLSAQTLTLADLSATPGAGGVLKPFAGYGTVLRVR